LDFHLFSAYNVDVKLLLETKTNPSLATLNDGGGGGSKRSYVNIEQKRGRGAGQINLS